MPFPLQYGLPTLLIVSLISAAHGSSVPVLTDGGSRQSTLPPPTYLTVAVGGAYAISIRTCTAEKRMHAGVAAPARGACLRGLAAFWDDAEPISRGCPRARGQRYLGGRGLLCTSTQRGASGRARSVLRGYPDRGCTARRRLAPGHDSSTAVPGPNHRAASGWPVGGLNGGRVSAVWQRSTATRRAVSAD
jgi:hypothetical protein